MTSKEKNRLRERIGRLRQIVVIGLMLISGIWYVTKGRDGGGAEIQFYASSKNAAEIKAHNDNDITEITVSDSDSKAVSITENRNLSDNRYSPSSELNGNTCMESDYEENINSNGSEQNKNPDGSGQNENSEDGEGYSVPESQSDGFDSRGSVSGSSASLVNLNTATLQELDSLPGVGPATAKNILEYREKYGGFADIEEIKNVKRIGDKTYEKLKDYITVQ